MMTMRQRPARLALPKSGDRLRLGDSGLRVSPLCVGLTAEPETIVAAYEAGVNFFFVSADLHWPMYEATRLGLRKLLEGSPSRRDEVVVGVVSYLHEPLFGAMQFNEVIESVPGLERVDLLVAGAVSSEQDFYPRAASLAGGKSIRHLGATATGASFHSRRQAVVAVNYGMVDIAFTRYNTSHPGAARDLYPHLSPRRAALNFNFKSVMSRVTPERFAELGFREEHWLPEAVDYYRFALTRPEVDGILCSPASPSEVRGLADALGRGPLRPDEEAYMILLSSLAFPRVFD